MTTDPTITIAGLRAQVSALESAATSAADNAARLVEALYHGNGVIAAITAERDALAAQLAKVRAELAAAPKVCAIHSYALEGPCMTCGSPWPGAEKALRQERIEGMEKMRRISAAVGCPNSVEEVVEAVAAIKSDLASERAHLAACRTRIAGLERAADERSAEVARLTARVAELEARPVLTAERLTSAVYLSRGIPIDIAAEAAKAILAVLGPVTLPAQDAAERMAAAYCDAQREIGGKEWLGWSRVASGSSEVRDLIVESMRRALASLGTPPTSPTQDDPMRHHESRDYALQSPANGYWPADVGAVNGTEAMVMGAMLRSVGPHPISDAALLAMARAAIGCVDKLGAPPTSPPAARPVFAGVSEEELHSVFARAYGECPDGISYAVAAGLRAVLARLEVSLVAPVDPEQIAADITGPIGDRVRTGEWKRIKDAARTALTAAGIPVTPERGK